MYRIRRAGERGVITELSHQKPIGITPEFIQFTDEALGPWRKEGLSQGNPRTRHHLPIPFTRRELGMSDGESTQRKQLQQRAVPHISPQRDTEDTASSSQTEGNTGMLHPI